MKTIVAILLALTASLAHAAQIGIAWGASTGDVAGYNVWIGTASGVYTDKKYVAGGTVTQYTVNGLADGTKYFLAVTALPVDTIAFTESALSNEVSATTPTITPTTGSTDFGEGSQFATGDSGNGNLILAQGPYQAIAGPLATLSFYVTKPSGSLRLALYKDANGKPGALVAQTAAFAPVAGWNRQPPSTTVTLTAGAYWLAYQPSDSVLSFVKGGTGPSYYASQPFTSGLPATFPAVALMAVDHWSMYATIGQATTPLPVNVLAPPIMSLVPDGSLAAFWSQWYAPGSIQPLIATMKINASTSTCLLAKDAIKGVQARCGISWTFGTQATKAAVTFTNGAQIVSLTMPLTIGPRACAAGVPVTCGYAYTVQ